MKNLLVILFFATLPLQAQTLQSLKEEAKAHQQCLDNNAYGKKCAQDYYTLADQHLNTVYKKLMAKLNDAEKLQLKQEQRKWLKKRDVEFNKIQRDANELFDCDYMCHDYLMIVADEKADFVLERVKELIMRLDTLGK